jgi:hypothetical protein
MFLVKPDTIVAWHRRLVANLWHLPASPGVAMHRGRNPTDHRPSRSRETGLGLPPHPRRTRPTRHHHRRVNRMEDPQERWLVATHGSCSSILIRSPSALVVPGFRAVIDVGLTGPSSGPTRPRSRADPRPVSPPVLGPQLGAELTDQPHRLRLLLIAVPTIGRLPRTPLCGHDSILVSKAWSLRGSQGGSKQTTKKLRFDTRTWSPMFAPKHAADPRTGNGPGIARKS